MPETACLTCGNPYTWTWEEAFDKCGFCDGDLQVMTEDVVEYLSSRGYTVESEQWGLHNTIITSIKKDGVELIPESADCGYDDPRDYLPADVIQLLDAIPDTEPLAHKPSSSAFDVMLAALHNVAEDCRMALNGEWDRGDNGFEATLEVVTNAIDAATQAATVPPPQTPHAEPPAITRDQFMAFFRDDLFHHHVTPDDCVEIFRSVMVGASDFTKPLIDDVLHAYGLSYDDLPTTSREVVA